MSNDDTTEGETMTNKIKVILLGASVGKEWNLAEFPQRTNNSNYIFETITAYQYDKTEALEEILMRPKRKFHLTKTYFKGFIKPSPQIPNIIIIKECAAYFPGDIESYKALMMKWVKKIRDSNIEVMLATAVPVTKLHSEKQKNRIETIRAFNDWLREYTKLEKITLIDLETALRIDQESRFLRDDFDIGDGLHLNKKAYNVMDQILTNSIITPAK